MRSVFGLVLTAQAVRDLGGQTTEGLILCVYNKPSVIDVLRTHTDSLHAVLCPEKRAEFLEREC
jgi:hypothetical protein